MLACWRSKDTSTEVVETAVGDGSDNNGGQAIFQKAVVLKEVDGKSDEVLDGRILEVVRFKMESRWVERFSMETPAAIIVRDDKFKELPATGFTFMPISW